MNQGVDLSEQSSRHSLGDFLLNWNCRFSTQFVRILFSGLAFLFAFAFLIVHTNAKHTLAGPIRILGDEISYDSIAWSLSKGEGILHDTTDSEFREPYEKGIQNGDLQGPIPGWKHYVTGYRPPLYPLVLSIGNRAFGRQFWFGRGFNFLCVAGTCGLIVWVTFGLAGPIPAFLGGLGYAILDWRVRESARRLLTESFAVLLVALFAMVLIRYAKKPSTRMAILSGLLFGVAALSRGIFVLWTPVLIVLLLVIHRRKLIAIFSAESCKLLAAFLVCFGVVYSPWAIRNCLVTGEFMPLGTQGSMELSAGYSDIAYANGGLWNDLRPTGFYDDFDHEGLKGIELEVAYAQESKSRAVSWSLQNWYRLPLLVVMKLFNETVSEFYSFSLIPSILGFLFLLRREEGWVFCGLVLSVLFSVALTWSVAGRFLFPLMFINYVCAGVGFWAAFLAVTANREQTSTLMSGE